MLTSEACAHLRSIADEVGPPSRIFVHCGTEVTVLDGGRPAPRTNHHERGRMVLMQNLY
jgi:hypothetical protein